MAFTLEIAWLIDMTVKGSIPIRGIRENAFRSVVLKVLREYEMICQYLTIIDRNVNRSIESNYQITRAIRLHSILLCSQKAGALSVVTMSFYKSKTN